jgi:DMSO/TMAO reductase YedYZ molybdopterin-dependent catalytic subunit
MLDRMFNRRKLLLGSAALALSGCKVFDSAADRDSTLRAFFASHEGLTMPAQRALIGGRLAPEYTEDDIRQGMRANGSTDPAGADYRRMADTAFRDYRLTVTGLVDAPVTLSLADLTALPSRTQITRHDCVEGWSCIGQWKGVQLSQVLAQAQPLPAARFVVFRCFDSMDDPSPTAADSRYYESIDFDDAYHPQTLLAYELNDQPLPVSNGAPLRCRVERQLGYKHAKYVSAIELVASLDKLRGGKGGYWEDEGYEWYAGI